ncbi:hypothetical protein STRDD04_01098 [Streptococcus sp. DD04]|nr:hypothetical protein STRDD04_01098 [Streptococcus sp. DD04]
MVEKVVHIVKIVVVVVHSIASLFYIIFIFAEILDKKSFPYLL